MSRGTQPNATPLPLSGTLALLVVLALQGAGCDSADDVVNPPVDSLVSDFSLRDVNPTSPTFDASVSPRDYLGQISAWYFGHAT